MSASHATLPRAADARYEGGFDRWNCHARAGWALLWRASEHGLFVLGEGRSVWRWDSRDTIWSRIPQSEAAVILQEHDQAMARLRRALPVIRLYEKLEAGPEREAARLALQRIGVAIVDMWQEARLSDGLPRGVGWFDSPAAVYRAVTRDACMHLQAAGRIPFDAEIYAELVAGDQEDLRAGRRQQIPRMRPLDMADVPRESGTPAWQRPDQNPFLYPGPARARRR